MAIPCSTKWYHYCGTSSELADTLDWLELQLMRNTVMVFGATGFNEEKPKTVSPNYFKAATNRKQRRAGKPKLWERV